MASGISALRLPPHNGEGLRVGWSNTLQGLRQAESVAA